jgi:hypothetical protein
MILGLAVEDGGAALHEGGDLGGIVFGQGTSLRVASWMPSRRVEMDPETWKPPRRRWRPSAATVR